MCEKFINMDLGLKFRSKKAETIITILWKDFYSRIDNVEIDRAIWICNQFPAWVGVKPGSPNDDPYDEPMFVLSTDVDEIESIVDSISDQIHAKGYSDQELLKATEPVYQEYYEWLRDAIKRSWEKATVQKLHSKNIQNKFGIYTTEIDDLSTLELSEMDWLTGDKLRK